MGNGLRVYHQAFEERHHHEDNGVQLARPFAGILPLPPRAPQRLKATLYRATHYGMRI